MCGSIPGFRNWKISGIRESGDCTSHKVSYVIVFSVTGDRRTSLSCTLDTDGDVNNDGDVNHKLQ